MDAADYPLGTENELSLRSLCPHEPALSSNNGAEAYVAQAATLPASEMPEMENPQLIPPPSMKRKRGTSSEDALQPKRPAGPAGGTDHEHELDTTHASVGELMDAQQEVVERQGLVEQQEVVEQPKVQAGTRANFEEAPEDYGPTSDHGCVSDYDHADDNCIEHQYAVPDGQAEMEYEAESEDGFHGRNCHLDTMTALDELKSAAYESGTSLAGRVVAILPILAMILRNADYGVQLSTAVQRLCRVAHDLMDPKFIPDDVDLPLVAALRSLDKLEGFISRNGGQITQYTLPVLEYSSTTASATPEPHIDHRHDDRPAAHGPSGEAYQALQERNESQADEILILKSQLNQWQEDYDVLLQEKSEALGRLEVEHEERGKTIKIQESTITTLRKNATRYQNQRRVVEQRLGAITKDFDQINKQAMESVQRVEDQKRELGTLRTELQTKLFEHSAALVEDQRKHRLELETALDNQKRHHDQVVLQKDDNIMRLDQDLAQADDTLVTEHELLLVAEAKFEAADKEVRRLKATCQHKQALYDSAQVATAKSEREKRLMSAAVTTQIAIVEEKRQRLAAWEEELIEVEQQENTEGGEAKARVVQLEAEAATKDAKIEKLSAPIMVHSCVIDGKVEVKAPVEQEELQTLDLEEGNKSA